MKISFIISTYNIPTVLLAQCVTSLLELSLSEKEREIIVIDDGSETSQLSDLLSLDPNIIYLRQPNSGLSAARNMGLRIASGDYIQFVDADDMLIKVPYEHCLDLVRFRNPDIVLFNTTDNEHQDTPFFYDGPMTGAEFMHNNNVHGSACSYIFKRSILGNLRFTEGLLQEDEEFTPLLLLRAEKLYSGDCNAYYYRKRADSITHQRSAEHTERRLSDMEKIILHLKDLSEKMPRTDRLALERRVAQLTMDYLYNTIKLTHSMKQLDATIERLTKSGLYPLPDKNYTKKYQIFRHLIKHHFGKTLLMMTVR